MCFKEVKRVFRGSFMDEEVSRIFQECFIIFKGFSGFSRVFPECFKEVLRKLSRCLKKCHVSWHSLQLPEQKEGLFSKNLARVSARGVKTIFSYQG